MNRIARMTLIAAAAMASLLAQESQPAAPAEQPAAGPQAVDETKPLIDAMAAIGGLIAGADKPEAAGVETLPDAKSATTTEEPVGEAAAASKSAPNGEPKVAKKPRSAKNSVILITSGAAAGAALGQAMGRNSKSAMIGAALGGAVGLIYDRMTYKDPKGI